MNRFLLLPAWLRALLINFTLWTMLCALAGMTTLGDAERAGDLRSYWRMTLGWWCGYLVLMVESYLLYVVYRRHAAWLATPRRVVSGYVAFIALGWPSAMLGLAFRRVIKFDREPTLANAWQYLVSMDKFEWFVVFVLMTMAFGAVVSGLLWRRHEKQASELARTQLSLEVQRLAALRGQLEPHFMFNTLSAIGAMVRVNDKPLALDGLARLGTLLQYVLASSERDWIGIDEEWQFVDDYLDLQRLRFGPRLQVRVDGAHLLGEAIECPPMLLQPLVENALRHDLECHEGASDIVVTFASQGPHLLVQVSNPIPPNVAPKGGLGIGLRGTRARLRLAYGDTASLDAGVVAGRFVAALRIPRISPA